MKTLLSALIIIFLAHFSMPLASFGQKPEHDAKEKIIAFLKAVYDSDATATEVASKFISLASVTSSLTTKERYEIAAKHIQLLREGKSMSAMEPVKPRVHNINVIPYSQITKEQAMVFEFDAEQLQYIYAATNNSEVIQYFVYKKGKIQSFDYLVKGKNGPRYFIVY